MTTNPTVLNWIEEIKKMVKPDKEMWIDGSTEQIEELKQLAINSGIVKPLNQEKFPGGVFHRTSPKDAAKVDNRTFVCCENKGDASANKWHTPAEMYKKLGEMFDGVMEERTMYIIPFCLGKPGAVGYRAGIEITDSVYVVLNTVVLAKCGKQAFDLLDSLEEDAKWFKGLHSTGKGVPLQKGEDNRYICHFVEDNAVWAINTGCGANAFFSKTAMALRLSTCLAKEEGWLAEHMAIIEIKKPALDKNDGANGANGADNSVSTTYIAAAFPSGCGKTALSMLSLPQSYVEKGYEVRCVSDDIAWLKKGKDGRLWAVNPETGIFGKVTGVNSKTSPNVLATAEKNAIFINTAYAKDEDVVWWEGLPIIDNITDWKGNPYIPNEIKKTATETAELLEADDLIVDDVLLEKGEISETDDGFDDLESFEDDSEAVEEEIEEESEEKAAPQSKIRIPKGPIRLAEHYDGRFTVPVTNCPCLSSEYDNPEGVPISAIIFGGKRSKSIPLVFQAFDWEHGVFIGSMLGTEVSGAVRRDPMGMLSFCGYNMADYWKHWLKIGKKLGRNAPKIFNVNWFKVGFGGVPVWPGFGENIRVLDWIVKRVSGNDCGIVESPVGYLPKVQDIDLEGLEKITAETVQSLLNIERVNWREDVNGIRQFYAKFGDKLPGELKEQLVDLEKRLMSV